MLSTMHHHYHPPNSGLQCMTATTLEVRAVLKALGKRMDREATDYTGQHVAMSLYGLQWMSGDR